MIVTSNIDLKDFQAWGGGKDTLELLIKHDKTEEAENYINDIYPEGLTEHTLNDLLWFESEWIFREVGINEYTGELEEEEDTDE